MIYYKYRPINQKTLEILLRKQIYFPKAEQLNDPLDARINIKVEYERVFQEILKEGEDKAMKKAFLAYLLNSKTWTNEKTGEKKSLNEMVQQYLLHVGILSLSKKPNDALLWSHYGDGHKGLCLGFLTDNILSEKIYIRSGVKYLKHPPYREVFLSLIDEIGTFVKPWEGEKSSYPDELGDAFYTKQLSVLIRSNLFTKSEKWAYEEEYRMIRTESGLESFAPKALQEIIFGIDTSAYDIETIRSILTNPEWEHVKLRKVQLAPGSFEFDIIDLA